MSVEQVLGLYNYWIVIFLMMTGFYIVIARSNLIKTVIGLNIFQISVILLYVSMGKISGGTAPIVPPALVSHGHSEVSHGAHDHGDHGSHEHATAAAHDDHGESHGHNDDHQHDDHQHEDDHGEHSNDGENDHSNDGEDDDSGEHAGGGHDDHANESGDASKDGHSNSDPETGHGKVIYSNPLPSVLMLTAIVVGIATTALALALIVRIREDYGTIEEDEILELDRAS